MYSSSMDQITLWYVYYDNGSRLKTQSSNCGISTTIWTVSHPIRDMQLLLTVPRASSTSAYAACYTVTLCSISAVLVLLLLLAGDIETHPGPTGK